MNDDDDDVLVEEKDKIKIETSATNYCATIGTWSSDDVDGDRIGQQGYGRRRRQMPFILS